MKKILLSLIVAVAAFGATEKEVAIATYSLQLGMHLEKNKEQIQDWTRFYSFKKLQQQIENVDCKSIKPSDNPENEYLRGICEFVNTPNNSIENKKSTMEGLNTLAYAATASKNAKYYCSFALALNAVNEWNKADYVLRKSSYFGNDEVCDYAREVIKTSIKKSLKTSKDASNECAIQK